MTRFILELIAAFCEMVCCILFFGIFCNTHLKKSRIKTLFVILVLSILFFGRVHFRQNALFWKEPAAILLTAYVMRQWNALLLKHNLFISVFYHSFIMSSDVLSMLLATALQTNLYCQPDAAGGVCLILFDLLYIPLVLLAGRAVQKEGLVYFDSRRWKKFLFFPLYAVGAAIWMFRAAAPAAAGGWGGWLWAPALALPAMLFLVLRLIGGEGLREKQIQEYRLLEIQNKNKLQQYDMMIHEWDEHRRLSHEYNNQIDCIRTLCESGQYEELEAYLQEVAGRASRIPGRFDTNHAVVNAILNAKYQEAAEKGIVVVYKVNDMSAIHISRRDIALLLSNLLNNAIEACEQCTGEKRIRLKLVHENHQLFLSVNNSFEGNVEYNNGVLQTTRKDAPLYHGYGLQNVRRVIEDNQGYYAIQPREREFLVSIIIPQ